MFNFTHWSPLVHKSNEIVCLLLNFLIPLSYDFDHFSTISNANTLNLDNFRRSLSVFSALITLFVAFKVLLVLGIKCRTPSYHPLRDVSHSVRKYSMKLGWVFIHFLINNFEAFVNIRSFCGQHVFYFYHNIFIEKKELVTDQILFIKWPNIISNDQTGLITDIFILILNKWLIYWSNNYLTE